MAKYKLNQNGENEATGVLRDDGACIPFAPGNRDFTEYNAWLAEGNTPDPADVPPAPTYQDLRAAEYPPAEDYLDAIVKGDTKQQKAYIDKCLAVKAKYPKL